MVFLAYCIYSVSCSTRDRFLEAILLWTERKLAGPGRPGTVDRPVVKGGAPGGAAPYVTGRARFTLPREVGTLFPPQGCPLVPWRLPPLHPLALLSRGTGKPRTHRAARTRQHARHSGAAPSPPRK